MKYAQLIGPVKEGSVQHLSCPVQSELCGCFFLVECTVFVSIFQLILFVTCFLKVSQLENLA